MPLVTELVAHGWDGIRVWCDGCRHSNLIDFAILLPRGLEPGETLASLAARFACRRCGGRRPRPEHVSVYFTALPQRRRPEGICDPPPNAADP